MRQGSQQPILVFRSGELTCALPLSAIQEVVPMALLLTPPGLPSLIAGLLNLRGTAIPIIRVDRLFGAAAVERQPGLYTPLIILRDTERPLGMLVSAVEEILTIPEDEVVAAGPSATLNDCAMAGAQAQGRTIHFLSIQAAEYLERGLCQRRGSLFHFDFCRNVLIYFGAATISLGKAIYLDRTFVLGHYHLALRLQKENEREPAARHFRTALELLSRPWNGHCSDRRNGSRRFIASAPRAWRPSRPARRPHPASL